MIVVPEPRWTFHKHAWRRMVEMGVGRDEVLEVVTQPEITRPGGTYHFRGRERTIAAGGRMVVVYIPEDRIILTVLWREGTITSREHPPCISCQGGLE